MASTDWSPVDHMGVHSTAPDLFGGELFGDELIDMYNSDAVVGANEGKNVAGSSLSFFVVLMFSLLSVVVRNSSSSPPG